MRKKLYEEQEGNHKETTKKIFQLCTLRYLNNHPRLAHCDATAGPHPKTVWHDASKEQEGHLEMVKKKKKKKMVVVVAKMIMMMAMMAVRL